MSMSIRRRMMGGKDTGPGWKSGVPYDLETGRVTNAYIDFNGVQKPYNGWSCTDYLPCHGAAYLRRGELFMTLYNAFYDENKSFVSNFYLNSDNKQASVPENAYYFRVSFKSNTLNKQWNITPYAE